MDNPNLSETNIVAHRKYGSMVRTASTNNPGADGGEVEDRTQSGAGMGFGIGLGVVIGVAIDNLAAGVALGVVFGVAFESGFSKRD